MNKDFTHPNILSDGSICLDMLTTSIEPYKGWKSGYTVLSNLIQLQNFFFDVDENFITFSNREIIKEQVIKMNQFKCPNCKHSEVQILILKFLRKIKINSISLLNNIEKLN